MKELQTMKADSDSRSAVTAPLIHRFNEVFLRHDPTALPGLIAENCVIEKISPAPNGDRCVGREACIALWTKIATAPGSHFDLEETFVMGDRAIICWRFWNSETTSIRGVNLMRVNDGLIVEAMGYVKGA
jgi:hypothetical protein